MAFEFGVEIRPDGTSGRYIRGALDGVVHAQSK